MAIKLSKESQEIIYKRRRLVEGVECDICSKIYQQFCEERNFKIYYVRHWTTDKGERYYDVGSHCEYFVEVD